MSESRLDPERIAALIDGRLDEEERRVLLERLAASPEEREVYADVLAVLGEMETEEEAEEEAEEPPAAPLEMDQLAARRRSRWRSRAVWLPAAALLAAAALVPLLWSRIDAPASGERFAAVALVESPAGAYAGSWSPPGWSARRSAADVLPASSRSARLGVHLAALELALRSGSRAAAAEAAAGAAILLEGFGGGAPAASLYRSVGAAASAGEPVDPGLLTRAREAAAGVAAPEWLELGVWAESARAAASTRDAAFFVGRRGRAAMERALALDDLPPEAAAARATLRRSIADPEAVDFAAARSAIEVLLREIGG